MIAINSPFRLLDGSIVTARIRVSIEIESNGSNPPYVLSGSIKEFEHRLVESIAEVMNADVETIDPDIWGSAIDAAFGGEP